MKKLTELRISRNLTLIEAAKRVGITHGYLSNIETGRYKMTDVVVKKLAELYNISQKDLWAAAENTKRNRTLESSWISQIMINGNPLPEAFAYHLLAQPDVSLRNDKQVAQELIKFIASNITSSLISEMDNNHDLLTLIIERVNETKNKYNVTTN